MLTTRMLWPRLVSAATIARGFRPAASWPRRARVCCWCQWRRWFRMRLRDAGGRRKTITAPRRNRGGDPKQAIPAPVCDGRKTGKIAARDACLRNVRAAPYRCAFEELPPCPPPCSPDAAVHFRRVGGMSVVRKSADHARRRRPYRRPPSRGGGCGRTDGARRTWRRVRA